MNPSDIFNHQYYGLSKREYFAAFCLSGIIANSSIITKEYALLAFDAVALADALVEELSKEKDNGED